METVAFVQFKLKDWESLALLSYLSSPELLEIGSHNEDQDVVKYMVILHQPGATGLCHLSKLSKSNLKMGIFKCLVHNEDSKRVLCTKTMVTCSIS